MLEKVRRIVTGLNGEGRSVVLINEQPAKMREFPAMGIGDAWITESVPADNREFKDLCPTWPELSPPKGGARIAWFWHGKDDPNRKWARGADRAIIIDDTKRHPSMHRTNTLDYVVLIKGRMRMLLDKGEVDMNPGDVLIQRGTNHAWTNLYDEPALLFSMMFDAVPGVGRGESFEPFAAALPDRPFKSLKRTITGHNASGDSVVLFHGPVANAAAGAVAGVAEVWQTIGFPADMRALKDLSRAPVELAPPRNGVKLRWFWIMPDRKGAAVPHAYAGSFATFGATDTRAYSDLHPGMYRSRSVDYVVCLSDNTSLLLEEDEVALNKGDVVVQRGTNHAWINTGTEPALYLACRVDAKA